MTNELGTKIRELRKARRLTQEELGERAGRDRGYIAGLETCRIKRPSAQALLNLAEALGVDINVLYKAAGYELGQFAASRSPSLREYVQHLVDLVPPDVPVYSSYPASVGGGGKARVTGHIYRTPSDEVNANPVEAYICQTSGLEPLVMKGSYLIVEPTAPLEHNDVIVCLYKGSMLVGRLRKIAEGLYVENNEDRIPLEQCESPGLVRWVQTKLK